jgi:hypothetical protein
MAEIIENGTQQVNTHNGKINAALTTGIIGTSLGGLLALGALGKGTGLFGMGNAQTQNMPPNNGNCFNANEAYVMDKEELYLERQASENKLAATTQFYQGMVEFNKTLSDNFFAAYERDVKNSFDLYKLGRDQKDELTKKIDEVDKKVDVMAAIRPYQDALINARIDGMAAVRPYQDALINAKIDNNALLGDYNLFRATCRTICGELVLPSTPTVTGYASYNPCACSTTTTTSTTA